MENWMYAVGGGIAAGLATGVGIAWKREGTLKQRFKETLRALETSFSVSEDAVFIVSEKAEVVFTNPKAQKLLKIEKATFDNPFQISLYVRIKNDWQPLESYIETIERHKNEKLHAFPDILISKEKNVKNAKSVTMYIEPMVDENRRRLYIVVLKDIEQKRKETLLMDTHQLTGLPNKIQAKKDLHRFFSQIHQKKHQKMALMVAEIDHLVKIRATIGDEQADKMLQSIAKELQHLAQENGYHIYHTFSNHFLFILPDIESNATIHAFFDTIQRKLKNFYTLDAANLHMSASVGAVIYPDGGTTYTIWDNCYKALDEAKEKGYGHCIIYKRAEIAQKYDEIKLYNAIHDAIESGEFEIYYQPIVRTGDHEVVAAEALIRWKHPEYGYVPPPIFIPMLEKSGYIVDLGKYVLSEVLKQQKKWELFKFKPIEVSINMSLLELESGEFVSYVSQKLQEHQVAPELIKFEITEGIAMQNETVIAEQLNALKRLGVGIALDDFGTGYTSFSYLKKIPATVLKIDKSLLENIVRNQEDQQIIHAMIELAHNLDMKIVAEGIETKQMVDILTEFRCDYLQGYYFSKPLPVFEFQEKIRFSSNIDTTLSEPKVHTSFKAPPVRSINQRIKQYKENDEDDILELKE